MPIECARDLNPLTGLYIGPLGDESTGDLRMYDLCNIYISSVGIPKELTAIGELWLSYEVALLKPRMYRLPVVQSFLTWACLFKNSCTNSEPLGGGLYEVSKGSASDFHVADEDGTRSIKLPREIGSSWLVSVYWMQDDLTPSAGLGGVPGILGANVELQDAWFGMTATADTDIAKAVYDTDTNFQATTLANYVIKITNEDESSLPTIYWDTDGSFSPNGGDCRVIITLISNEVEWLQFNATATVMHRLDRKGGERTKLQLLEEELEAEKLIARRELTPVHKAMLSAPTRPAQLRPRNTLLGPPLYKERMVRK